MRLYFPRQKVALEVDVEGREERGFAQEGAAGWSVMRVRAWQMDDDEQFDRIMRALVTNWQRAVRAGC